MTTAFVCLSQSLAGTLSLSNCRTRPLFKDSIRRQNGSRKIQCLFSSLDCSASLRCYGVVEEIVSVRRPVLPNCQRRVECSASRGDDLGESIYSVSVAAEEASEDAEQVQSPTTQPPMLVSRIPTFLNSVVEGPPDSRDEEPMLVGEDAAVFDVVAQKTSSWIYFTLVLGVVLAILYYTWLDANTGYAGAFIDALSSLFGNHEVVMLALLAIFALVHSGLAGLRVEGEKLMGERAYRVLFAGTSLPLAVSAVVYFINHRYDGVQLWQFRTIPGVHEAVWIFSFISFLFLYPSTFNLLEVAAVDKPKLHLWETGIMRITRHPQMVGQFIWCLAHTIWIGNSFTLTTSLGLLAHHLFGVWHGDRRLAAKYGDAFEQVKDRTSIIPFAAILDGRQKLPDDYYKEFLRVPYYVIVVITVGAYFSHPSMQIASHILHW